MNYQWLSSYPEGIAWDASWDMRPAYAILDETVSKYGERPAFDFLGKCWTWQEIGEKVANLAGGLQKMGVEKGTKVGLFLPNTPYYLIAYYAILKAGGTVVNYNPLYVKRELIHQIKDSQTKIMFTLDLAMLYDKMQAVRDKSGLEKLIICPFTEILPFPKNILFKLFKGGECANVKLSGDHGEDVYFDTLCEKASDFNAVSCDPEKDVAVLQYTGGTTGVPKGAMLSHANVLSNVEQACLWFVNARAGQEKMLGVLPFFHVFAMTAVMNLSVRLGFEIVALPRFDLEQALKLIDKKKPHYMPAVPAIYNAINNYKDIGKYDLKSLRYCISGGAPLPVEVKKKFETLTGCIVVEGYGLTESSPVACVNPLEGVNKPGSIGMPLPGTIVKLRNPETGEDVPEGEKGELCIKGPQVMLGYWQNEEDTQKTLKDGFLRTGDIATMDDDGYFYIVDRIKDLIITNGYNVYPRNVEEAIYLHEDVEECIVAGIPDPDRGELVKAWVKPKEGRNITAEDLKAFLKKELSSIEIPRRIEIRTDPLPKTMIGKLSRKDIVEEELNKKPDEA